MKMQSQTAVAVTKAPKPSAPQPTGTIMPPLKKQQVPQQQQQQSVVISNNGVKISNNNNILNSNGTKLVKNSKKVSNNVKNNLSHNNNNKSDIKNHNTSGVISKIISNGHSNNGSSCSVGGSSEGSSTIMVTPPSDVRGKKILKEAVDAVVNSFAKHTQGYGRGESPILSFILNLKLNITSRKKPSKTISCEREILLIQCKNWLDYRRVTKLRNSRYSLFNMFIFLSLAVCLCVVCNFKELIKAKNNNEK